MADYADANPPYELPALSATFAPMHYVANGQAPTSKIAAGCFKARTAAKTPHPQL
jgi:hypothetical protein